MTCTGCLLTFLLAGVLLWDLAIAETRATGG
jgi:hypothetical protein